MNYSGYEYYGLGATGDAEYSIKTTSSKIAEISENLYLEFTAQVYANNAYAQQHLTNKKDIIGIVTSDINKDVLIRDTVAGIFGGPYMNSNGKTIKLLNSLQTGLDVSEQSVYTFNFTIFSQNGVITTLLGSNFEETEIPLSATGIYLTALMNGSYFGSRISFNVQGYKYNI